MENSAKAIFFDRDGTLIADKHYLCDAAKIDVFDGIPEALKRLKNCGWRIFMLSNQSGVSHGYFTLEQAEAFNDAAIEKMGLDKGFFDGIKLATELSEEIGGYRKPSPRYVVESAEKFSISPHNIWIVGDRLSDWQTAINARAQAAAVRTGEVIGESQLRFLAENNFPVIDSVADIFDIFGDRK